MAFHVACPITCRRVCDCELGFGVRGKGGGGGWAAAAAALEGFLADPWLMRPVVAEGVVVGKEMDGVATVQVEVPVVEAPADDGEEEACRAAMQRQAAAAEDYARRLEGGAAAYGSQTCKFFACAYMLVFNAALSNTPCMEEGDEEDWGQEDLGNAAVKVMCRLCFSGENEGSTKATKMLPCKLCNKKYHRNCLKNWGEHRDLFHWSSWVCPSCRSCEANLFNVLAAWTRLAEVCRRPGDPNKLMFCKRCDGAYHCYCQQPSHKNVTHGPYLCPKHTRCHSCGSGVPGSGHSTRWFLGYTCCDACGRLFVKGNYCPVCLKVYRDSEVIPMVCCDVCEKWVHIECDGISEEKYQQFQSDQNLQYTCAACRGECSQIRDTEDAVRELWKRRDIVDHDLMASLRAAAALPSLEDVSPSHPNSDDEKLGAYVTKNDARNTLKFSFKSNSSKPALDSSKQEKSAIKSSGSNKKHSKKKGTQNNKTVTEQDEIFLEKRYEAKSGSFGDQTADVTRDKSSFKNDSSAQSVEKALKSLSAKAAAHNADMIPKVKIKGSKHVKDVVEENAAKSDTGKGTKLVIHIGSRHKGSPKSEMSNSQKEQELVSMHGGKVDVTSQFKSSRSEIKEKSVMKLVRETGVQQNSLLGDLGASKKHATGKRSNAIVSGMENASESGTRNRSFGQKQSVNHLNENQGSASFSVNNSPDSLKPSLLKLKFKRPIFEQPSSQASQPEEPGTWASPQEELNVAKGQRSKRKRPSLDKNGSEGKAPAAKRHEQSQGDEAMDANWILRKLGKDAIGKRIEVQLASDGKWHQGAVSNVINGTLCLQFDNGNSENIELGKRAIRLIAQRSKGGKR
uniref:PHD-type domain-containing protein n=1 Tax=Leersia perrieri TaxID=77586 RepID=A0A0D9XZW5_9ORYZ